MKEITLNVAQGIGDIFWVYQKFAPHFGRINFNIMCYGAAPLAIQARAVDWVKQWPRAGAVAPITVDEARYTRAWRSYFPMAATLARHATGHTVFDYGCNRRLEQGVRLELIDPAHACQWQVPVPVDVTRVPQGPYVAAYVPGAVAHAWAVEKGMWPTPTWVKLLQCLYARYKLAYPVVVLGAPYDEAATHALARQLGAAGFAAMPEVGLPPAQVLGILSKCVFYVGHQSGLNVMADNLGTQQLMLYMPALKDLMLSWPQQATIASCAYNAATFAMLPEDIAAGLKWPGPVQA